MDNSQRIKNMSQVLLVSDLDRSKTYYDRLGFRTDGWGHCEIDGLLFILRQAKNPGDVRPLNKVEVVEGAHRYPHNVYDTYAYLYRAEMVDELYAQFKAGGAMFAYEPFTAGDPGQTPWRRFGLTDPDGYVIIFGAMVE
jgi:catechol 2,3-dioxygenase-like lactoylglutathione lyase family enzyme